MSTNGTDQAHAERTSVDLIAGLMAAASLFVALLALAYHPLVVSVAAFLLGLIAAGMSRTTSGWPESRSRSQVSASSRAWRSP